MTMECSGCGAAGPPARCTRSRCRRQRSVSTTTGRFRRVRQQPVSPRRQPHDNAVLRLLRRGAEGADDWQGVLRARSQAPQRSPLSANQAPPSSCRFRRPLPTSSSSREGRASRRSRAACGPLACALPKPRAMPATQPHQPVRLHRKQVRVPPSRRENIAWPNTLLNAAMADSLDPIASELEATTAKGEDTRRRCSLTSSEHKQIVSGNNYAAEWTKEASKRGLLNLKNTIDAQPSRRRPSS